MASFARLDDAGNFHGIAFLAQYLVDLSFAMHGVPPGIFLESE
jgi:hypothetical protein